MIHTKYKNLKLFAKKILLFYYLFENKNRFKFLFYSQFESLNLRENKILIKYLHYLKHEDMLAIYNTYSMLQIKW